MYVSFLNFALIFCHPVEITEKSGHTAKSAIQKPVKTLRYWLGKVNPRRSFRTKLGAAIATAILIFSMLLTWIVGNISQAQAQADRGELLSQLAYQLAGALDRDMYIYYQEIQTLASLAEMRAEDRPMDQKRLLLERLQTAYSDFAWIGLANPQGVVLASTQGLLEGENVAQRPWFVDSLAQPSVQNVHPAKLLADLLPHSGDPREPLRLVDVAAPVMGEQGNVYGVLGGHLYWQWASALRDSLLQPMQDYRRVDIQIVANTGELLLAAEPGQPIDDITLNHLPSVMAAQGGQLGFVEESWSEQTYLTGYAATQGHRSYPGLGWIVLVRQPTEEAYAAAEALKQSILVWGTLLGLLSGALSWWIAGQMIHPVLAIARAAEQLRHGDLTIAMPIFPGRDEIAQLSRSVAQLFANLDQQKRLLEEFNADLENQVMARTETLHQLNDQLHHEIDVRRQAEAALNQAIQELQRLTLVDGLTGITNRRGFDQYLEQEWQRALREHLPLSLILLDVDYFKAYNDHYGHQDGDRCLQQVAQATHQTVQRATDLAARYGGEEFAVILPNTDTAGAMHLAEAVRTAIQNLQMPHARSLVGDWVSISLGVATCYPAPHLNPINLIATADDRLYQAKHQGRDRVVGPNY